jgi:hypothetical protein
VRSLPHSVGVGVAVDVDVRSDERSVGERFDDVDEARARTRRCID